MSNGMIETLLIQNIGRLVTMVPKKGREGPLGVIHNASLRIVNGSIAWIGADGKEPAPKENWDEDTIDANGLAVMPGLVDAHTHLVHGGYRQHEFVARSHGVSYWDIVKEGGGILNTVAATRKANYDDLYEEAAGRADEAIFHGTTTIEVKTGYGLDIENEMKLLSIIWDLKGNHDIRFIPTLLAAHALPKEYETKRDKYVDMIVKQLIPRVAKEKLAFFCDAYVEKGAFTRDEAITIMKAARKHGMQTKLHVDQFSNIGGGRLAEAVGAISADHLDCISEEGITAMQRAGSVAVLLPGATFFMGHHQFAPARQLIDAGVPVAIASDYNPGTSPSLDLFLMATMGVTQMQMTAEESLQAITINAAKALGLDDCGVLDVGKRGDVLVLETTDEYLPLYRFGSPKVRTVILRGQIIRQSHAYNL